MYRLETGIIKEKIKRNASILFVLCFVLLTLFCYRDFLTGKKFFVSLNDAMDMYDQFYPNLVNLAKHIECGDTKTQIDFSYALGTEISFGIPTFSTAPAYFGVENIAYLMGLMQVFKMLIAGISFYFYVILMGKRKYIASICAIAYAFCGHMIVRQYWLSYATEVALFAFWLFTFELWERKKNRAWLPLATVIFALNLSSVYYLVLYAGIIGAYIIFRAFYFEEFAFSRVWKQIMLCGLFAIVGFGLPQIVSQFSQAISSNRFQTGASKAVSADFIYSRLTEINTLICRTIGVNMLGSGKAFSGVMDYLRAPVFYIGLLGLMLILPIFLRLGIKQKLCILFVGMCAGGYIFINILRKVANGFADDGYKMSSFWIIVVMVFTVAQGLDLILKEFKKNDLLILLIEAIGIEAICAYNLCQTIWKVNNQGILITMGMAALYAGLFIFYYFCQHGKDKEILLIILLFFAFLEAGMQLDNTLQTMRVMKKEEFGDRIRYNDYTLEALEYLEKENELQDYRIDKQYFSYRYNDAWIQGYNGTSFYLGGTGADRNVTELYEMMKLPCAEQGYKYSYGTSPFTELGTVMGIRYIISQRTPIINYGYEQIYDTDGIYVFENQNAIPIGYSYNQYITRREYENLDLNSQRKSIVDVGVIEELSDVENYEIKKADWKELSVDYEQYKEYAVNLWCEEERNIYYLPRAIEEDEVLVVQTLLPLEESQSRGIIDYYTNEWCMCYTVRMDQGERQVFDINAEGTYAFAIAPKAGEPYLEMNDVVAYIIPKDVYYEKYRKAVAELKEGSLDVEEFSGDYISGRVKSDKNQIFCLAVPYGNWKIYIDGKEVDTFLVNVAFTGCVIEEGNHLVEARYSHFSSTVNIIAQYVAVLVATGWGIVMIVKMRRTKYAGS